MKQMSLGEWFQAPDQKDSQTQVPGRDEPGSAAGRVGFTDRTARTCP